jgi:TonB family protein
VEQTQVAYIPPVAIRQVAPVISTSEREMIRRMSRPLEIQVSVSIDEFGKVTRAEPVSEGSGMADYMGRLAARAARQWQFRPAKRNGRDVPSEMMVRFQFGSPR